MKQDGELRETGTVTGYHQTRATNNQDLQRFPEAAVILSMAPSSKWESFTFIGQPTKTRWLYGGIGILTYNYPKLEGDFFSSKPNGMSVRCLKD